MMSRRTLRLGLALLLPLMLLRGLLPPGYMPVAEHGQLRIVLCSAGPVLPDSGDGDGTDRGPQLPPNAGDCPFAKGWAGAPPVHAAAALIVPRRQTVRLPPHATSLPASTGPPRTTAARAPPRLS